MAEIKNFLLGILIFGAVVFGMATSLNEWYANASPARSANTNFLGLDNSSSFIRNWANDTAIQLQTNPITTIPFIGPGAIIIYRVVSLVTNIPAKVVGPMISSIAIALNLPAWFIGFVTAALLLTIVIAVINAIKGGST